MEVAIVHYWMVTWRGGEKVIKSLMDLFPRADIYTLFYDESAVGKHLEGHQVHVSSIDGPILRKNHQKAFPLYPKGIASLRLEKKYDLILSSESGPSKGIPRAPFNLDTPHLCYVHTPMRYCYGFRSSYLENLPLLLRPLVDNRLNKLMEWDLTTVDNVDHYLANSDNVRRRIKKYWHQEAEVCYPPIALDLFAGELKEPGGDYYLSFGALTPYKKVDLLVEAFNKSGKRLVIIGEGSERQKLEARALDNIEFVGYQSNNAIQQWVKGAQALIFPGEEDFGMIPLEVMAVGLPVIAFKAGGAMETVVENREEPEKSSGIFFLTQDVRVLNHAIEDFEKIIHRFDPAWIRSHARNFGEDAFQARFIHLVENFLTSRT